MNIQALLNAEGRILIALPGETSDVPKNFDFVRTDEGTHVTLLLANGRQINLPPIPGPTGEAIQRANDIAIATPTRAFERVARLAA